MDPFIWPCKSRAASLNLHTAALCVARGTCWKRWTIGRGSERGSGIFVMMAWQDDENEAILTAKKVDLIFCFLLVIYISYQRYLLIIDYNSSQIPGIFFTTFTHFYADKCLRSFFLSYHYYKYRIQKLGGKKKGWIERITMTKSRKKRMMDSRYMLACPDNVNITSKEGIFSTMPPNWTWFIKTEYTRERERAGGTGVFL